MTFPPELIRDAFRAPNGEFGWRPEHVSNILQIVSSGDFAVLGGEFWWIRPGARNWTGLIPQIEGPEAVYSWSTNRRKGEQWSEFVKRCAQESIEMVKKWATDANIPEENRGQIFVNFTWVSESRFNQL